jgi:hypothetical protein
MRQQRRPALADHLLLSVSACSSRNWRRRVRKFGFVCWDLSRSFSCTPGSEASTIEGSISSSGFSRSSSQRWPKLMMGDGVALGKTLEADLILPQAQV